MKVIGIIGGVASGKSTVTAEFARLGAVPLNADEVAHRVLDEDAVKEALRERWGDEILGPDGRVNRASISRKVFGETGSDRERRFLEEIVHPRVRHELEGRMEALKATGTAAVVLDVPLLLEAGWADMCDVIYFVESPREIRARRAAKRGWAEEELQERESAQWSTDKKRRRADRVIVNSGSLSELRDRIASEWQAVASC